MDFRKQAEIRINPLKSRKNIALAIENDDNEVLKIAAQKLNTTVAEIVRVLISNWVANEGVKYAKQKETTVFFRICYGIKSFNSDGSEKPYDVSGTGALYPRLEAAKEQMKIWFDGQCEEMRRHSPRRRKQEQAFAYVEAVTGICDSDPDGVDAGYLLTEEQQKQLNESVLTLNGSDV